jgi:hypothetical protein
MNRVTIATPGDGVVRLSRQQAMVIDPSEAVAEGGSMLKRIALNCHTIY